MSRELNTAKKHINNGIKEIQAHEFFLAYNDIEECKKYYFFILEVSQLGENSSDEYLFEKNSFIDDWFNTEVEAQQFIQQNYDDEYMQFVKIKKCTLPCRHFFDILNMYGTFCIEREDSCEVRSMLDAIDAAIANEYTEKTKEQIFEDLHCLRDDNLLFARRYFDYYMAVVVGYETRHARASLAEHISKNLDSYSMYLNEVPDEDDYDCMPSVPVQSYAEFSKVQMSAELMRISAIELLV